MSVSRIGLLVGEVRMIHDQVTLQWKDKLFRVWIEEEFSDWVHDSVAIVCVPSYNVEKSNGELMNNSISGDVGDKPQSGLPSSRPEIEKRDECNTRLFRPYRTIVTRVVNR
ncbi:hypothetical protein Hanom_Chr16g01448331 [Helianthus anomalus]